MRVPPLLLRRGTAFPRQAACHPADSVAKGTAFPLGASDVPGGFQPCLARGRLRGRHHLVALDVALGAVAEPTLRNSGFPPSTASMRVAVKISAPRSASRRGAAYSRYGIPAHDATSVTGPGRDVAAAVDRPGVVDAAAEHADELERPRQRAPTLARLELDDRPGVLDGRRARDPALVAGRPQRAAQDLAGAIDAPPVPDEAVALVLDDAALCRRRPPRSGRAASRSSAPSPRTPRAGARRRRIARCGRALQARGDCTGRPAPPGAAARIARSRLPRRLVSRESRPGHGPVSRESHRRCPTRHGPAGRASCPQGAAPDGNSISNATRSHSPHLGIRWITPAAEPRGCG